MKAQKERKPDFYKNSLASLGVLEAAEKWLIKRGRPDDWEYAHKRMWVHPWMPRDKSVKDADDEFMRTW